MSKPATRVAVLTASGRGAVAVVRLWGPEALAIADAAFRPRGAQSLRETPRGRPRVGSLGDGPGDDVVAVVCGDPRDPEVEIHGHGGPAAIDLVVRALEAGGAERVAAREWSDRGPDSSVERLARAALPHAPTLRTAEILLDQAAGAWSRELERLDTLRSADPGAVAGQIERLLRRAEVGQRLLSGWRVVLAGRPNVGKSRLLNALAGFDRAIVSPTAGTTRDVIRVSTALEGWPVELIDTAGLRDADDPLEALGVSLALATQERADLTLAVLDQSEALTPPDLALIDRLPTALRVASKCDLAAAWSTRSLGAHRVSAATGEGIPELVEAIASRLVPEPPAPGDGVPLLPDQLVRIRALAREIGPEPNPPRA